MVSGRSRASRELRQPRSLLPHRCMRIATSLTGVRLLAGVLLDLARRLQNLEVTSLKLSYHHTIKTKFPSLMTARHGYIQDCIQLEAGGRTTPWRRQGSCGGTRLLTHA